MTAIEICVPRGLLKALLVATLVLAPIVQHERATASAAAVAPVVQVAHH